MATRNSKATPPTKNAPAVVLTQEQADLLAGHLSDINYMSISMNDIARRAMEEGAGSLITAIEEMSKLCARKADLVARHLGEIGYGNFEEEFVQMACVGLRAGKARAIQEAKSTGKL